jgi:aldehyde dehydrogenase (NAD+)
MIDETTVEEVRKIFDAQSARRWVVAQSTAQERIGKLTRVKDAIASHRNELADAVHADFRKHAAEFEFTEIFPVMEELKFAIEHLAAWMEPVHAKSTLELVGAQSAVRHEPLGLVLILAPWNYPFHLAIIPLISAIAAGNCVVLKPSNKTSNTARVIAKLVSSAFNQDEVAVVTGDHRIADALLDQPFDHVFFTGTVSQRGNHCRNGVTILGETLPRNFSGDVSYCLDRHFCPSARLIPEMVRLVAAA